MRVRGGGPQIRSRVATRGWVPAAWGASPYCWGCAADPRGVSTAGGGGEVAWQLTQRTRTYGEGVCCCDTLMKGAASESYPFDGKAPQETLYKYTHAWRRTRGGKWQFVRDAAPPRRGELHVSPRTGRPRPPRHWFMREGALRGGAGESRSRGACSRFARNECTKVTAPSSVLLPVLSTLRGRVLRAPVGRDPQRRPGARVSLSSCAGLAALLRAAAGTAPKEAAALAARARTAPRRTFSTAPLAHARLSRQAHKEPSLSGSPVPLRLLPSSVPSPRATSTAKPLPGAAGAAAPSFALSDPHPAPPLPGMSPPMQSKKAGGALEGASPSLLPIYPPHLSPFAHFQA